MVARKFKVHPRYIKSAVVSLSEETVEYRMLLARTSKNPRILKRLSHDEDIYVRQAVASNHNTPGDILVELFSSYPAFAHDIASNTGAPEDVLKQLAESTDPYTCYYVATNPSATPEVLELLVDATDPYIRDGVLTNPNVTIDIAEQLIDDPEPFVRADALNAIGRLDSNRKQEIVQERLNKVE